MKIFLINALTVLLTMPLLNLDAAAGQSCEGIYNQKLTTLQGEPLNLCDYQDKPIIVVNTASKCGFTPQFEALESLYSQYKDQGLMIIGFPSNDFKQEPKSNKEIGDFCKLTYSVKFPMMAKSNVVGEHANDLYKSLMARTGKAPKWNFYKYLILPYAKDVFLFESVVQPRSPEILNKIKPYLKKAH